jgi:hypothetical protein
MHCRDFKDKHVAFVDDTLAGVELVEMQQHLDECPHCARQDAKIRRALLLVRNLPVIELSPRFSARLEARLAESRSTPLVGPGIRKRMAAAATLAAAAMIGYIAITLYRVESSHDLMMAPVVASTVESEMTPLASPPAAILASAPAGLAIWPAALFAEQAPVHFARARFSNANVTR